MRNKKAYARTAGFIHKAAGGVCISQSQSVVLAVRLKIAASGKVSCTRIGDDACSPQGAGGVPY